MLTVIFAMICVILLVTSILKYQYSHRKLPPGPLRLPLLGNILHLLTYYNRRPWVAINSLSKKYGDVYSLEFGKYYGIALCSYEAMDELLNHTEWSGKITNEFTQSRSFDRELGLVFVSNPKIWVEMRKFSQRTLRDFGFGKSLSMQAVIEAELTDIIHELKATLKITDGIITIKINFLLSILNVTWSMIAGIRYSHDDIRLTKMMKNNFEATKIQTLADPLYILFPWIRNWFPTITKEHFRRKLVKEMHEYSRNLLQEIKNKGFYLTEPQSFIDVFLQKIHHNSFSSKTIYTEEQLIMMIEDFFQIGSTTTSATLNWAIIYLITYPHVQRRIQKEIDASVPAHLFPTMEDIKKMPYTQATILEIHRYSGVVPNPAPRVLSKDTVYRTWRIPKGTYILSNHYSVMMDSKHWGDPENFRPERFINSSGQFVPDKRVIHFGFGKRYCLAATLVNSILPLYLTTLLQQFDFSLVPGKPRPTLEPELGFSLSPYPFETFVKVRK